MLHSGSQRLLYLHLGNAFYPYLTYIYWLNLFPAKQHTFV